MALHNQPTRQQVASSWLAAARRLLVCALFCLGSGSAVAEETSDPFGTEAMLPPKPVLSQSKGPALSLDVEVGDPCVARSLNHALDLLEVVNLALCNNSQTREAWANSRAQAAQVGVSKAGYLPSAAVSASANRNLTGTNSGLDQRSIGLNISYLLYDFGSRAANLENARQLLAAASATQDSTVQAVFLGAVQAFYQAQAALAALDAALESERAAKESFAAAEARYIAGSATLADKLQARTAFSQATLNRITADGYLKNAQGALANMLGLDANRNVSLVAANTTVIPDDFEGDINTLIEEARLRRPDLQAAAAQTRAAEASADATRAADRPTISLNASSNQNTSAGISSRGSQIGIALSVPIFSGYAPTYRVRAAEAQLDAKNIQLERLRLQVALDVWTAYQNLITATQSLRSTADLLDSAEQSERVALGRYKAGVGNMLDVLNAQSALASARRQRIQSAFDWNINRATLAQAMGSLDASLLQTLSDTSGQRSGKNPLQKN
jgi:outer membrane protein